jgi:hypothetical protein
MVMKKFALLGFLVVLLTVNVFANDSAYIEMGTALRNVYGFGPGILLKTDVLPIHWGMNLGVFNLNYDHYFPVSTTSCIRRL